MTSVAGQAQVSAELLAWVAGVTQQNRTALSVTLVAGDASPRRYFRVRTHADSEAASSLIAVISPPTEKNEAFLAIRDLLQATGIRVPNLVSADLDAGFLLLEDFGDALLLDALEQDGAPQWYPQALQILRQQCSIDLQDTDLPPYDEVLLVQEMDLFPKWFVGDLLGFDEKEIVQSHLDNLWACLVENAVTQPQVVVHRDFHSRNLMCLDDGALGVIDFQDAVIGPITYDLVSLLKDCYIVWPRDTQLGWLRQAFDNLPDDAVADDVAFTDFVKWFDLMGLQRHLKVLGVFSRLALRDGKPGYLRDIPLVMRYIEEVLALYSARPEVSAFSDWWKRTVAPVTDDWDNIVQRVAASP